MLGGKTKAWFKMEFYSGGPGNTAQLLEVVVTMFVPVYLLIL
jgi:hypothetical protein